MQRAARWSLWARGMTRPEDTRGGGMATLRDDAFSRCRAGATVNRIKPRSSSALLLASGTSFVSKANAFNREPNILFSSRGGV